MRRNKNLGIQGEELATNYLYKKGYKILCRNFRCQYGEIDIIAYSEQELVFVEVKTRTNLNYGRPAEAVNREKQEHIKKVANYYTLINKLQRKNIRFDIIEVYFIKRKKEIIHIKNFMYVK